MFLVVSGKVVCMLQHVLPADKPRLLPGSWSPSNVLRAVRLGVDIFDSSFPFCTSAANNNNSNNNSDT